MRTRRSRRAGALQPAADSFKIALDGAKAQLGAVRNQILNLKASYQQSLAEITQAEADIPYYQTEFDRQQNLRQQRGATRTAFDQAKHNLDAGQQKVAVAKAEAATTLAQLGGNADQPVEQNPLTSRPRPRSTTRSANSTTASSRRRSTASPPMSTRCSRAPTWRRRRRPSRWLRPAISGSPPARRKPS
jgi:hypothetical protein